MGMEQYPTEGNNQLDGAIDLCDSPRDIDDTLPAELTPEPEPPDGLTYLREKYPGNSEAQAANYALALVVALKHTDAAMNTDKDVSVLGVPSQQLLSDILLQLPLGVNPPDSAGELLFDEFKKDIGAADPDQFKALIVEFLRVKHHYYQYFNENTDIENKAIRDNMRPMYTEIRYLAEAYVDKVLRGYVLPHEGGKDELLEPELLHELCEPYYLRMVFNGAPNSHHLTGLHGETIIRLMNEARALGIAGSQQMPLQ